MCLIVLFSCSLPWRCPTSSLYELLPGSLQQVVTHLPTLCFCVDPKPSLTCLCKSEHVTSLLEGHQRFPVKPDDWPLPACLASPHNLLSNYLELLSFTWTDLTNWYKPVKFQFKPYLSVKLPQFPQAGVDPQHPHSMPRASYVFYYLVLTIAVSSW